MKTDELDVQAMTSDEFKTTAFRVDQKMAQILFRDKLYSAEGRLRVIAQEYMANARDAHRAAGKSDEPIDVTMPSKLAPEFIVRDYGIGISPQVVEDIFVVYGASTKKKDEKQNGGYGLGAKCAFSYVNAFTVTTIHAGIKYSYAATIDSSGMNQFMLMDQSETQDRSGTEIRVPIKLEDIHQLRAWILEITHSWTPRPNIVNASTIAWVDKQPVHSGDKWQVYENGSPMDYRSTFIGIMATVDDIPYHISTTQIEQMDVTRVDTQGNEVKSDIEVLSELLTQYSRTLVLNFKINEVIIPPQRESIDLTTVSKTSILRAVTKYIEEMSALLLAKFSAATTQLQRVEMMLVGGFDNDFYLKFGGDTRNMPADTEVKCVDAGVRIYKCQYKARRDHFADYCLVDDFTTSDLVKWVKGKRHDYQYDSGRCEGFIVVSTDTAKLSEASIKTALRSLHDRVKPRKTVLVVNDVAKFEAAIGDTVDAVKSIGYKLIAKPAKVKKQVSVSSGYLYIKSIEFNLGYNGEMYHTQPANTRVWASGKWVGNHVWVHAHPTKPDVYIVKDQELSVEDLKKIMLFSYCVGTSEFNARARPQFKVYIWNERYTEYNDPTLGASSHLAGDVLDDQLAKFLKRDICSLSSHALAYKPPKQATDWFVHCSRYASISSVGLNRAMVSVGYRSDLAVLVEKVVEYQAADGHAPDTSASHIFDVLPMYTALMGGELARKLDAAAVCIDDMTKEIQDICALDPTMSVAMNMAATNTVLNFRVGGSQSAMTGASTLEALFNKHKSVLPINPSFK